MDHFVHGNRSGPLATDCFYPCFEMSWPLRDGSKIYVVESSIGHKTEPKVGGSLVPTMCVMGAVLTVSSLTVALLVNMSAIPRNWRPLDIRSSISNIGKTWSSSELSVPGKAWRCCLRLWILYNLVIARVLSPSATVAFILTTEWFMWSADPGGESFNHVGQWSALVGATLVTLVWLIPALGSRVLRIRFVRACAGCVLQKIPSFRRHVTEQQFPEPDPRAIQWRRTF